MTDENQSVPEDAVPDPAPRRLRLPPIIKAEDEGVGDVISRLSRQIGITPCGGCRERQQRLNEWMPFRRG
jgi:hypothetical protein